MKKHISISKHPADIFKHLVLLILAALITSDLSAQTWTGNTNTDWNTSTNWNPASVPTGTSNVIIPGALSSGNWPVFGSNVTINSINMQPGSQMDVNGFTFTLNGQQAYIWILGATLNNSSSGSDIIINLCTGPAGWADYLRSLTVNDDVIFNLSGSSLLIEGDQSPPCQYYGDVTFNISGDLQVNISNVVPSDFHGNLAINRTVAGVSAVFPAGGNVTGNYCYTNNAGGPTYMGASGAKTNIDGMINITASGLLPSVFEMHRIINHTAGGAVLIQNTIGFFLEKDTLQITSLNVTGYRGNEYGRFLNNQVTGNVTISDDPGYAGGWITYIRNNLIIGNTGFYINGTNAFCDGDVAGTGNNYNGNVSYHAAGGPVYIASGAGLQCSGDLVIARTSAGPVIAFITGASTIGGNFSFTNNTGGVTVIGNVNSKTSIAGTVNVNASYTTPDVFEMHRLINQTAGGVINVENPKGFNMQKDTLTVASLSITGYTGDEYGRFLNNQVAGNVTISDDPGYANGWATYIYSNKITGNASISCNGANAMYDAAIANSGNIYSGNVHYTRTGGILFVATADTNDIAGNLFLNSTSGIILGLLKFNGNTDGILEQSGSQPISIATLIISKAGGAGITLNDSVTITTTANFIDGNIYTSPGNNLIFPDNIFYLGSSGSSHVIGPVTKIGDDAFVFPVGSPTSLNAIAISAPVGVTSRFRAEFKNQNPTSDGYNTGSKAGSFGTAIISKAGYWNMERLSGTTNVSLTLGFGENPYEQYPALGDLKVAHWNGSQWDDHGNGGTTGTPSNGTVTNSVPITGFSPFTLAGVANTLFYSCSNPGPGPDGTPVKIGGKGGFPPYSIKQLPDGNYIPDSIFLVANGATAGFKGKDFWGVEMDDTTITAPTAPSTLISVNGNGTVDFRGWRHYVYMRDAGNNMMGAIKDHDLTLGSTTMKTYFSAGDVAVSPNGNIYLRRSFTISSQYSPEGNKSIRFYITETELDDLIGADPVSFPDGLNSLTITHYTGYRVDSIFNPIPGGNAVIISNNDITMLDTGNGIYSLDIEVPGFSGFYIGGNNSNLNICPGSTITIPSDISGSAYQWQVDNGGGFVSLTDNDTYSGTSTRALTIANAPGAIYGYHYRCVVDETIYSQVYTIKINVSWEGSTSAAWEDPSNWSCNVLPDSGTEVIIGGKKPNYPRLNSNRTVRSVEISPRAKLTITAGYTLQISQ